MTTDAPIEEKSVTSVLSDTGATENGTAAVFEGVAIDRITIHDRSVSGNVTVTELSALSADDEVSLPGDGPLYAVDIAAPTGADGISSTIQLTLDESTLGDVPPERVRLTHLTDDGWSVLETSVVGVDEGSVTLTAETPGFSVFALIATDETPTGTASPGATTTEPATTATTGDPDESSWSETATVTTSSPREFGSHPGLGMAIGVVVILGVAALRYRRY